MWWGLIGLVLDLVGVLALGYDVVRIQRSLLASARANRRAYEKLDADFGATPDWLSDLKKSLTWVPGHAFQEHHAQDEVSYNAERIGEISRDIADAASGLAEYVAALAETLRQRAHEDADLAGLSLRISGAGLALIVIGFLLQAHGSVIQTCGSNHTGLCRWLFWI